MIKKSIFRIIIGFFFLSLFLWFRFIRERLPKDIPMNLTIIGLFVLIYLSIIYIYLIKSLIDTKKNQNLFIKKFFDFFLEPLKAFDYFLKNFRIIKKKKEMIFKYMIKILDFLILEKNIYKYVFEIIPRFIIVIVFMIDVYFFHKMYYFYKIIIIGLLILLGKYILYSFEKYKNEILEENKDYVSINMDYEYAIQIIDDSPPEDEEEDDFIPPTMRVPLLEFLEFQKNLYIEKRIQFPYRIGAEGIDKYQKENYLEKMELDDIRLFKKEKHSFIEDILKSNNILNFSEKDSKINNLKILIYLNFLLCWLYIIVISLPIMIFNINDICYFLQEFQIKTDPFSFLNLHSYDF